VFGGLAQLVERLLCKQDVSGSSPLTSTQRRPSSRIPKESGWVDLDPVHAERAIVLNDFSLQSFQS
jgi:hypothetical protein